MANDKRVLVEILQGTGQQTGGGCSCSGCPSAGSCGPTIDFKKEAEELSGKLIEKFGDNVEVKYVDLDAVGMEEYPVMNKVMQMGYPFPITLINGDPRFAGGIMDTEVENAVQVILEEKSN